MKQPELVALADTRELVVRLGELKDHMRIEFDEQDSMLLSKLRAATNEAETFLGCPILERSYTLTLEGFPASDRGGITLPNPPIRSITSVVYYDENGDAQTLDASAYMLYTAAPYPQLVLLPDEQWPNTQRERWDAVVVTYVAGFTDTVSEVPQQIKEAILLRASTRYENTVETGQGTVAWKLDDSFAFRELLMPYRVPRI